MKEKELEKLKKDAQHLQNKQNEIYNLPLLDFGYGQTSEKQTYVHLVCAAQAASVAPLEYLK
jgi:hypothetical protein